jgi:hypothetical protein
MDLYRIIGELVEERERLQRIIESLEAMSDAGSRPPRLRQRGRGRKSMDASARKEVSARMKLYWAKRRGTRETENGAD